MSRRTAGLVGLVAALTAAGVASAQPPAAKPVWQYAHDLRVRKGGSTDFDKDTPKVGIEVFKDDAGGALVAVTQAGNLAVIPAAAVGAEKKAAWLFAHELFGWRETQVMDMGPMGKYRIFGRKFDLGGIMNKPKEMAQVPPNWGFYFRVTDLPQAVERVKANGGRILNGPMEVPGGSNIVNCMDPQGAAFSLHQTKA